MKETKHMAIDLGATSGRVILATVTDRKVRTAVLHRFHTPLKEESGKYYWDLSVLLPEIAEGVAKAKGQKIDSIGVDTWGVDVCPVLPDGTIRDPRAYRDPYTADVPERFFKEMSRDRLYGKTGIQTMNFNTVFQLYAQSKAGDLKGVDKILFMPDAVSYFLTGRMVCEYTILSTSAMMDPRTRDFDPEILEVCGLKREMFPDVVLPGTRVGTLKPEFGLGDVPVVAVAGHDTGSAVAAVPADCEDFAYLSSGTWSLMGIETPQPVINEQMSRLNFTNEGGATGNIRLLKNITGMWLLEQCLEKWRGEGREYGYAELERMAAEAGPSKKLIDPDSPAFAAPTDMPAAICAEYGAGLDDGQIVRLIYDSLAAKYQEVFHLLEEISGKRLTTLNIIGGGCQNSMLCQMTADRCGVRVVSGPAECTALGNIMIQAGLTRRDILNSVDTKTYYPHE